MVTNTKTARTIWTEHNVMVHPLDTKRIADEVTQKRPPKAEHGGEAFYKVRGEQGIVFEPKLSIIDDECCGSDITKKDKVVLYFYEEERVNERQSYFSMFPSLEGHYTIDELKPYLLPPVDLKTHMGERYNYNGRIENNLYNWLKHFNSH